MRFLAYSIYKQNHLDLKQTYKLYLKYALGFRLMFEFKSIVDYIVHEFFCVPCNLSLPVVCHYSVSVIFFHSDNFKSF